MSLQGIRWLFLVCFCLFCNALLAQSNIVAPPGGSPITIVREGSITIVFHKNSDEIQHWPKDLEKLVRHAQQYDFGLLDIQSYVGENEKNTEQLLKKRTETIIKKLYSKGVLNNFIGVNEGKVCPTLKGTNTAQCYRVEIQLFVPLDQTKHYSGRKKEPLTEKECYDSADRYIPTLERLYPLLTLNQALLVTQTEIDKKFTSLAAPLYSASAVGRLDIFKHLLKEQKKWKFEKSERIELMNSLIDNNLPDFVEALASSGMSIKDYEHPSLPIVRAVCDLSNGTKDEERLVQVVEVLLKWGASIEAIKLNDETYTPLICAQKRASLSRLVDLLQTKSSQQAHQKPIFSINSSWLGQYLKSDLTKMEKRKSQVMQCEKIGQCVASGGTWDVSMRDYNGYCIKDNEPACLARGGTWRRICLSQSLACVMAYPDADKDCTDGSQCISGRCLANRGKSKPEEDGLIHGQCKRNNDPCGCFSSINNGKTRGSMCVD